MGLSNTLFEDLILDGRADRERDPRRYKLATIQDVPEIIPILVESDHPEAPSGRKGSASGGRPRRPRRSRSLFDAIGVRIKDLPITPGKVLDAIEAKRAEDAAEGSRRQ